MHFWQKLETKNVHFLAQLSPLLVFNQNKWVLIFILLTGNYGYQLPGHHRNLPAGPENFRPNSVICKFSMKEIIGGQNSNFALNFPQIGFFQLQILHFWTNIFRQAKDFPTSKNYSGHWANATYVSCLPRRHWLIVVTSHDNNNSLW